MTKRTLSTIAALWIALLSGLLSTAAIAQDDAPVSTVYKALKCDAPTLATTWAIAQKDGANLPVEPYLSSLGQGESGTGMVTSPPFVVASDTITLNICGHDGPEGGRGENFVALVDARKGNVLLKTMAPGGDALQEHSWDVSKLKGVEVRIEVHDRPERKADIRYETLAEGIPFKRNAAAQSLIPNSGSVEIPCGFAATQLFFLGCTVSGSKPGTTCGGIEIHYRTGSPDVFPLMVGFTLDAPYKRLSPSQAMHLHASADPYQHYLAIFPSGEVIEKIRLVAQPGRTPIPRITAITCKTTAESDRLMRLPDSAPSTLENDWMGSHTISARWSKLDQVLHTIRKDHRMSPAPTSKVRFEKHQLSDAFRAEGLAVADFNGDGRNDIAAGNVYYAAPDWKSVPMAGELYDFNRSAYSDAFLCFADDVDGDGATDLITVGFPGQKTHWLRNPGKVGAVWSKHLAIEQTGNESPTYVDIDGDGRRELLCMSGGKCVAAQPGQDPTAPWTLRTLSNPGDPAPGHGLGTGDVNRDGHTDVLIPNGWWEGPATKSDAPWQFHAASLFGGAQLCVADFDADGDNDVLGSSAHGYGIGWSEQTADGWIAHEIDNTDSQTHAIHLADINGDGLTDFVTGKRVWAHNGHDPGSYEPAVLCWYEMKRTDTGLTWTKHTIDLDSGVGLHFQIVDLNNDKRPDIVTANKKGVFYFEQVDK